MIRILDLDDKDTFGFSLYGRVEKKDIEKAIRDLEDHVTNGDRIKMLAEIKNFAPTDISAGAMKEEIMFWLRNPGMIPKIEKAALVTDQPWISKMFDVECTLIPTLEGETFDLGERNKALEWLRSDQREAKRVDITLSELAENNLLRTVSGFALGWLSADLVRKSNRKKAGMLLLAGTIAAGIPLGIKFINNNRKLLSP